LGENGATLSGGQKQRLAIARALYKDPEILILDEATSSLDSASEQYVQRMVSILRDQQKTVIIIAHRLSTIQAVDKIITLKNGTVDEVGTPSQLAMTNGIYAQLLALQQRAPTERTKKQLREYEISS
jgi:ATP-binding cassette subfamily B protein